MIDLKLNIPDSFLEEEERSGFTISRQMKEVWAVQLDLFAEFDRVCRKHNIVYIASGGTMLGAVRHRGYIPWDDDMDLMMMRDQYEKLCEVAPTEFKHPYFFQTEETEPGMRRWFARLRNSETTAIQKIEIPYRHKGNQGIFIDIFPLDGVPDKKNAFLCQRVQLFFFKILYFGFNAIGYAFWRKNESTYKSWLKLVSHRLFGKLIRKFNLREWAYKKATIISQLYSKQETNFISLLSFQPNNLGHALRRSDMDEIKYVDFEFLKMPITANYDEHLRRKYGDYMTPTKNPNYHGELIFDTNISYDKYYQLHPEL